MRRAVEDDVEDGLAAVHVDDERAAHAEHGVGVEVLAGLASKACVVTDL